MTTYNTGNAVPSADARDRYDNSQTFDELINGMESSYVNRVGRAILSMHGMETEFTLAQLERAQQFYDFIISSGYEIPVPYAAGILVERYTQLIEKDGEFYRAKPGVIPFTTTGVWATDSGNLASVGDAALRQELRSSTGQGLIGSQAAGVSAVFRTLHDKMMHLVVPGDHTTAQAGGVAALGKMFIVPENSQIDLSVPTHASSPHEIYEGISQWLIPNSSLVNIIIEPGKHLYSETLLPEHPCAANIVFKGTPVTLTTTVTSLLGFSGVRGNYIMTLAVVDSSQFAVGDWLGIEDSSGTGRHQVINGFSEVTAVAAGQVSVRIRLWDAAFPTFTLTTAGLYKVRSLIKISNTDAVAIASSPMMCRDVGFIGNMWDYWLEADITGTEKGTHGFAICSNTIVDGAGTQGGANPLAISGGGLAAQRVYVADFDQQGFVTANGGGMFARNVWASACGRRNFYVGTGSAIEAKFFGGNQAYRDCVISDYGGAFNASWFYGSGCRLSGIITNNGGRSIAVNSTLVGNLQYGSDCRASGSASLDNTTAKFNTLDGAHFEYASGGSVVGADLSDNVVDGLSAIFKSAVRATNVVLVNNGRYGINALDSSVRHQGSTISANGSAPIKSDALSVVTDGTTYAPTSNPVPVFEQTLVSAANTHSIKWSVTSIGDLIMQMDGVNQFQWKTGSFGSMTDNTKSSGTAALRHTTVFAVNGTINTSDKTKKTPLRENSAAELRAAIRIGENVGIWQWLERYEVEGEDARLHCGPTVQDAIEIMQDEGLDPLKYGFICYDKWGDEFLHHPAVVMTDEKGVEVETEPARTEHIVQAGELYSFRSTELLFFIARAILGQQREIKAEQKSHADRLEALEARG